MKRTRSFEIIAAVYVLAAAAGVVLYKLLPYAYWMNLLLADIGATAVVFLFSAVFRNASVYDPYWSVLPPVALTFLAMGHSLTLLNLLHLAAVWIWGVRLTANWAIGFQGMDAQDWRYTMYQRKTGAWYPAVNFFGIHLMPTLIVYLCILPAVYAMEHGLDAGFLSALCVGISLAAAALQAVADRQMRAFRREHRGQLIRSGLWSHSRHPNYLGEILMWWGIGLSVYCAVPSQPWMLTGALVNTLLFLFISIPMADEHQSGKPGFDDYKAETRMLLPLPLFGRKAGD